MLILMVFLGVLAAALVELNKVFPLEDFTWKKFYKAQIMAFALNFVVGIIFILSQEEVNDVYPMGRFFAAIIGFCGQTIFLGAVETFTKSKKTAIGINKK